MKMLVFSFVAGTVLLYFLNIALLKTPLLDLHWSIHAGLRFLIGFIVLGVSYFHAHAVKFKSAVYNSLHCNNRLFLRLLYARP